MPEQYLKRRSIAKVLARLSTRVHSYADEDLDSEIPEPKMTNRHIVLFCGLLMGGSAFSIDIMLPAFSAMADDLNARYSTVQMVIPLFIIAVGISQLFMGSTADRFGRKPVLIFGLSVFVLGSTACIFGPTIEWVLAGRVLQGFGISAAPVAARAMLRDISNGKELARNMALAAMIFALCPIIAPLIGAGLMQFASWRILFVILMVFGVVLLLVTIILLPETSKQKSASATNISIIISNIGKLFSHPTSRYNLILSGIIMSMVTMILTNLPAVFDVHYGVTGTLFAILFALHGFGIIIGQIANRKYINSYGVLKTIRASSIGLVAVMGGLVLIVLAELDSAYLVSFCIFLFAVFYLVIFSNTTSLVLEHHPEIAGFGSAFYGFFSQVVSSLIAIAVVYLIGPNLLYFAISLFVISLIVLFAFLAQKPSEAHG